MIPGHNHPHEDPNQDVYILGLHLDHPQNPHHQARVDGVLPGPSTTSAEGELTSLGRNRFSSSGGPVMGLSDVIQDEVPHNDELWHDADEFEQKRYLVQRWEGGTICDMTGKPRAVEVQFHCSTVGTDHIALLRETSICEYLLVIHTPRLCSEPLFLDGSARRAGIDGSEDLGKIDCRPILSDGDLEKWKNSEEEKLKKRQVQEDEIKKSNLLEDTLMSPNNAEQVPVDQSETTLPIESANVHIVAASGGKASPPVATEQLVLGGDPNSLDVPSQPSEHARKEDEQANKDNSEDSSMLMVEPITMIIDTDTGKIYMDEHSAEVTQNKIPVSSSSESSRSTGNPSGGSGRDLKEESGKSDHDSAVKEGPSLEELTKALRESLGAVLRDLREEGGRQAANNAPARPLSELIAALQDSGATKSRRPRGGSKKDTNRPARNPRESEKAGAKPTSLKQKKGPAENAHGKLLQMYQNKFQVDEKDGEEDKQD